MTSARVTESESAATSGEHLGPEGRPDMGRLAVIAAICLCVVAGIILRYRFYRFIEPGPDSDESEAGLLALDFLRTGEWPLLYPEQPYGGLPWLWVLGPSLRVLGVNPWGLRVPVNLLALVNAGVVMAIGRSIGWSRLRSTLAGVAAWCYPLAAVQFQSRETLYFVPATTCGLVAMLLVLRSERHRRPDEPLGTTRRSGILLLAAGLALGLGFWINPGVLYLALPVIGWLGFRSIRAAMARPDGVVSRGVNALRPLLIVGVGAVAGSLPWWYLTLFGEPRRNNYAGRPQSDLVERFEAFFKGQMPGWTGFRVPYGGDFAGEWLGGTVWKVGFVALFLLLVFQLARPTRFPLESVLTVAALFVPLVFVLITARTGPLYTNLRYVSFASPLLALVMAAKWRRDVAAAAAVAILPVVAMAGSFAWNPGSYRPIDPVVAAIDQRGIACAYGDYWAGGNRLMFESEERIVAVPTYEARNPAYTDLAEERGICAWVYRDGQQAAEALEGWMTDEGIGFEEVRPAPGFVIYFPDETVGIDEPDPAALAGN